VTLILLIQEGDELLDLAHVLRVLVWVAFAQKVLLHCHLQAAWRKGSPLTSDVLGTHNQLLPVDHYDLTSTDPAYQSEHFWDTVV